MPATGQLPLLRYALIAIIATSLAGFGFVAVSEGLRNIDGPNAVADDYILVMAGIAFTLSCLPLLRNLTLEIWRDLHNRFADELLIMRSISSCQAAKEASPFTDAAINSSGLFAVTITVVVFALLRHHGESLPECVVVGGLCGGSLLVPFVAMRIGRRRPGLRFVACWVSGAMHAYWLLIMFGLVADQISLDLTTPAELTATCSLLAVGTAIFAAVVKLWQLFHAARRKLTTEKRMPDSSHEDGSYRKVPPA